MINLVHQIQKPYRTEYLCFPTTTQVNIILELITFELDYWMLQNLIRFVITASSGSRVKKLLLPETLEKGHNPNRLLPCERNENEAFT